MEPLQWILWKQNGRPGQSIIVGNHSLSIDDPYRQETGPWAFSITSRIFEYTSDEFETLSDATNYGISMLHNIFKETLLRIETLDNDTGIEEEEWIALSIKKYKDLTK